MSHFYGTLRGQAGEATRCGSKNSGLTAWAASWQGAVQISLYEQDGVDMANVSLIPWQGAGVSKLLYSGPVGEYKPTSARTVY